MAFSVIMQLLAKLTVITVFLTNIAIADEIVTNRGKQFTNCKVTGTDKHGVTFRHDKGIAKVAYADMSKAMQSKYGYKGGSQKKGGLEIRKPIPFGKGVQVGAAVPVGDPLGVAPGNKAFLSRYFNRNGLPLSNGKHRRTYVVNGKFNPDFRTNSLGDIVRYRLNGYSNISISEQLRNDGQLDRMTPYEKLYNLHFNRHVGQHYQKGTLKSAVIKAPRYLPYVRNIRPRQIGTFNAGPSGGSLVPFSRSGYSSAGSIAPSLVPARRR